MDELTEASDWGKVAGAWEAIDDVHSVADASVVHAPEGGAAFIAGWPRTRPGHHKGCTNSDSSELGWAVLGGCCRLGVRAQIEEHEHDCQEKVPGYCCHCLLFEWRSSCLKVFWCGELLYIIAKYGVCCMSHLKPRVTHLHCVSYLDHQHTLDAEFICW